MAMQEKIFDLGLLDGFDDDTGYSYFLETREGRLVAVLYTDHAPTNYTIPTIQDFKEEV